MDGQPSVVKLQQLWRMLAALPSFEGLYSWPLIPCMGSYLCAPGSTSQVRGIQHSLTLVRNPMQRECQLLSLLALRASLEALWQCMLGCAN